VNLDSGGKYGSGSDTEIGIGGGKYSTPPPHMDLGLEFLSTLGSEG